MGLGHGKLLPGLRKAGFSFSDVVPQSVARITTLSSAAKMSSSVVRVSENIDRPATASCLAPSIRAAIGKVGRVEGKVRRTHFVDYVEIAFPKLMDEPQKDGFVSSADIQVLLFRDMHRTRALLPLVRRRWKKTQQARMTMSGS